MKTFVISALTAGKIRNRKLIKNVINTILDDFPDFKVIILVRSKGIVKKHVRVSEIEFPKYDKFLIYRIFLFYLGLRHLSKKLNADIWLSLDSLTPWVLAKNQYSYFHNPAPFYETSIKAIKYGFKFYLYSKIYSFFIRFLAK